MDDDTTRRDRRDDDPGATGRLWPPPDDERADPYDEPADPHDEPTRYDRRPTASRDRDSRSAQARNAQPHGAKPHGGEPRGGAPDLQSTYVLSEGATRVGDAADPTRIAPDDARDWSGEPLPERPASRRPRAGRPRRARSGPAWPRIVAPIVLLAAVLTVVTLSVHAGVFDHAKTPTSRPTVAASHTATTTSKSKYTTYRVRSGDTMSGIAAKFNITVGQLMVLNPAASSTTIVVGQKLKVPRRK